MARLRRVRCTDPGIERLGAGRGFRFVDASGRPVRSAEVRARIRALAIPPAWTEVWICADPNGHLQATGIDSKGRRQYLYHEAWRRHRDRRKFDRMIEFGALLPKLRHACDEALALDGLPAERVVACGVALIDLGLFRVGSPEYTLENGSFGLCTVERRHVRIVDGAAHFDFVAKAAKRRVIAVSSPAVLATVTALKGRRGGGQRLLAARTSDGWREIRPAEINRFIKATVGREFSAKDFRTWNATVLAASALADAEPSPTGGRAAQTIVNRAMDEVAAVLGDTRAVTRSSYVDPRVVDRYLEGRTVPAPRRPLDVSAARDSSAWARLEEATLDLIADR